eukprot:4001428-Amphidinium_carterae.3
MSVLKVSNPLSRARPNGGIHIGGKQEAIYERPLGSAFVGVFSQTRILIKHQWHSPSARRQSSKQLRMSNLGVEISSNNNS